MRAGDRAQTGECRVNRQKALPIGEGQTIPTAEIIQMVLDRGRLTKDDILQLWALSEEDYAALKAALDGEKLIEPGPRRTGGFIARFNRKPAAVADAEIPEPTFKAEYERTASARLVDLLTHAELEELLGALVYTIRRARTRQTGLDRRGSKPELAAALLTKHGIDLFADASRTTTGQNDRSWDTSGFGRCGLVREAQFEANRGDSSG
jgi:hypothetical protein